MRKIPVLLMTLVLVPAVYAQIADSAAANESPAVTGEEQAKEVEGKLDGLSESYLETKSTVDKLAKIKISGYLQTQLRMPTAYDDATDSSLTHSAFGRYQFKVGDFAGGAFSDRVSSALEVRRGRVKVAYETALSQHVAQFDIVPFKSANFLTGATTTTTRDTIKDSLGVNHIVTRTATATSTSGAALTGGGVTLKDLYLRFAEPWFKSFALKMGVFDRPFGFEISYSSSSRETPERSRAEQTLFPGERDLGISLEYQPADNMPLWAQKINFKGGFFTGNGINVETDGKRDFIGRLGTMLPFADLNLAIDGGLSLYRGYVLSQNDSVFSISGASFAPEIENKNKYIGRNYVGGDLQLYYGNIPVIGGATLRLEGYTGTQPGAKTNNGSPRSDIVSTAQVYKRDFLGGYVMLVQNLDPITSQFVLRYDHFDPNTEIEGAKVSFQETQTADQAYKTLGIGAIYHWSENVKFTAYLDKVMNEEITDSRGVFTDDVEDDVFTFRIQYKF